MELTDVTNLDAIVGAKFDAFVGVFPWVVTIFC